MTAFGAFPPLALWPLSPCKRPSSRRAPLILKTLDGVATLSLATKPGHDKGGLT